MTTQNNVILLGGPRDGTLAPANDTALIEVELDGLVHRYVQTTATRDRDGATYPVYNYDGEVRPGGSESGVEDAGDRVASPLADDLDSRSPAGGRSDG
ncbi:hypothetical protein [Plantactinospora sonchi]|uniref:Uncharacterized protein n=1 Tax=Plantactinospora sonchi TaxID=1544735 RepID=A0ABU7RQC1_9ACTN